MSNSENLREVVTPKARYFLNVSKTSNGKGAGKKKRYSISSTDTRFSKYFQTAITKSDADLILSMSDVEAANHFVLLLKDKQRSAWNSRSIPLLNAVSYFNYKNRNGGMYAVFEYDGRHEQVTVEVESISNGSVDVRYCEYAYVDRDEGSRKGIKDLSDHFVEWAKKVEQK